jgi:hypothetical protein
MSQMANGVSNFALSSHYMAGLEKRGPFIANDVRQP